MDTHRFGAALPLTSPKHSLGVLHGAEETCPWPGAATACQSGPHSAITEGLILLEPHSAAAHGAIGAPTLPFLPCSLTRASCPHLQPAAALEQRQLPEV